MKGKDALKLVALGLGALLIIAGGHDEYYTLKQDPNASSWTGTFQHNLGLTFELDPWMIMVIGGVLFAIGSGGRGLPVLKELARSFK